MEHRKREAEDSIIGLVIGEQFVEQFRDVPKRQRTRITHFRGHRRLQNLAGIQPRQFLALADIVKRAYVGQRLERPTETPPRLLCRPRHAVNFALQARKQSDQKISLAQRIGAQHDRF